MLIAYMQEEVPEVLEGKQETDLIELMQWYRASKKRFDEDPAFKSDRSSKSSTSKEVIPILSRLGADLRHLPQELQ